MAGPHGVFDAINPAPGVRALEIEDEWSKRVLKIAVREAETLDVSSKLMLMHLRESATRSDG